MGVAIFENEYCRLKIKDGIMYADYKEVVITLPDAKKMVEDRIAFQKQQNYTSIPLLINLNLKYVNKAARRYFGEEGVIGISASAFIVKTLATKTLLKIFLLIENPKIPIRVFEDEQNAITWIKNHVGK